MYQEIKTNMAHNSSRAFYFRRKGISFDYITTIETKKYGNIDVCGCYNCRWCEWELILFSQKYNNECVGSFTYSSIKTPTDANMKTYAYRYMRKHIAEKK